jgi:hypothetical protein
MNQENGDAADNEPEKAKCVNPVGDADDRRVPQKTQNTRVPDWWDDGQCGSNSRKPDRAVLLADHPGVGHFERTRSADSL